MSRWGYLNGFCARAAGDRRLQPTHVSLYLALLREWGSQGFSNPFRIRRQDLMLVSRVSSRVTYHKRMLELQHFGYIRYEPTYNYYLGSRVQLLPVG